MRQRPQEGGISCPFLPGNFNAKSFIQKSFVDLVHGRVAREVETFAISNNRVDSHPE